MTDRTDRPHDRTADRDRDGADAAPPVNAAAGGAVGGAAGAAAGATAGTLTLGPIGTIVGALVGAVGGGWAGLAAAQTPPGADDEEYFREHHRTTNAHLADASYDRVRPAYHLGHVAARNPDYRGRSFDDVEPDLRRGWSDEVGARHGDWATAREFARVGYERGARDAGVQLDATPIGTTPSHDRASANDRLAADAPVAGNPNAAAPLAGAPEHASSPAPGWMQSPSDRGGSGTRRAPGSVRDSETGDEVR